MTDQILTPTTQPAAPDHGVELRRLKRREGHQLCDVQVLHNGELIATWTSVRWYKELDLRDMGGAIVRRGTRSADCAKFRPGQDLIEVTLRWLPHIPTAAQIAERQASDAQRQAEADHELAEDRRRERVRDAAEDLLVSLKWAMHFPNVGKDNSDYIAALRAIAKAEGTE